ncbi:MAG TPA: HigA family addiction module antitoxin [Stellaceae bacterium]|nr:HigA family addiction module antitoxin [Stellaceae bacterium]
MNSDPYRGDGLPAIHPGAHLRDDLDALEMSAAELARRLKVPTNRITGILNGQRAITADTALRLGQLFGTGPELWLRLQQRFDLKKARAEVGEELDSIRRLEAAAAPR